jgi:thioredoxin 1
MRKILFVVFIMVLIFACNKKDKKTNEQQAQFYSEDMSIDNSLKSVDTEVKNDEKKSRVKVTFIELGSVNCIPCKMMQPVMRQVEKKYKDQVKVVFYDVWTDKDAPMAEKYKIQVIPTQVFLDSNGVEFYRHQGFFPFEEVEKILKLKGVK